MLLPPVRGWGRGRVNGHPPVWLKGGPAGYGPYAIFGLLMHLLSMRQSSVVPVSCPQPKQLTIYKTQNVLYNGDTDRHFTFTSESILTCKQVTSTEIYV